eukprot:1587844-Pyramimonas_sp.AAC.1
MWRNGRGRKSTSRNTGLRTVSQAERCAGAANPGGGPRAQLRVGERELFEMVAAKVFDMCAERSGISPEPRTPMEPSALEICALITLSTR